MVGRDEIAPLHRLRQAHHQGRIGEDQPVEAELATQQVLQEFRRKRGRQDFSIGQTGAEVPGHFGRADVAHHDGLHAVPDHFAVHVPVALVPLLIAKGVVRGHHMLIALINAIAREVLHGADSG